MKANRARIHIPGAFAFFLRFRFSLDGGHANGSRINVGDGRQSSSGSHRGGSINSNRRRAKRQQHTPEISSLPNARWFPARGGPPRRGERGLSHFWCNRNTQAYMKPRFVVGCNGSLA